MKKRLVKCKVCGETFDINSVQGVIAGARRFAHFDCMPEGELVPLPQEDPDLIALREYIEKLFNGTQNYAAVNLAIRRFHEENGYSYSGIMKSLIYFYEVKGNSIEKANGCINIVPYCYQDAYNYYLDLFIIQQQNKDKEISKIVSQEKEVTIKEPRRKNNILKRLFNLED